MRRRGHVLPAGEQLRGANADVTLRFLFSRAWSMYKATSVIGQLMSLLVLTGCVWEAHANPSRTVTAPAHANPGDTVCVIAHGQVGLAAARYDSVAHTWLVDGLRIRSRTARRHHRTSTPRNGLLGGRRSSIGGNGSRCMACPSSGCRRKSSREPRHYLRPTLSWVRVSVILLFR
jgi:hypothetical protein